jgi:hypothetical protein
MKNILYKWAGYDSLLVSYCPIHKQYYMSVGVFFIFQTFLLFIAYFLLFRVSSYNLFICLFFSVIIGYQYSRFIISTNIFINKETKYILIISILMTIFNIALCFFINYILAFYYLREEIIDILLPKTENYSENVYYLSKGLFFLLTHTEQHIPKVIFCIVYVLIFFIFITPYILIYNNRNAYYHHIKEKYNLLEKQEK